jgi:hypothetical protein
MSDTSTHDDGPISQLREAARQGQAALAENADLKRRLFFVEHGVDLTTPGGEMLFQTWKDDGTPEELVAKATAVNALKATSSTPPPAATQPDPARDAEDAARANAHQAIANAAIGGGTPQTEHPVTAAIASYRDELSRGAVPELAANDAFAKVLGSAADPRLHFNEAAHRQAGDEADAMFEGRKR